MKKNHERTSKKCDPYKKRSHGMSMLLPARGLSCHRSGGWEAIVLNYAFTNS